MRKYKWHLTTNIAIKREECTWGRLEREKPISIGAFWVEFSFLSEP